MNEATKGYVKLMDPVHAFRPVEPDAAPSGELNSKYESALVSRVLAGDQAAFNEFYQRYVPRLYQFIYYLANSGKDDAEDILQETLLAAVRSLQRFKGDSSLYTWLCAIARHKVSDHIDHLRKLRQQMDGDADLDARTELHGELGSPEQEVVGRQAVVHALSLLPGEYRLVLLGKYQEGFSVRELAQIMSRSEKAVESLLTRAREAFRAQLHSGELEQR
jgi:RNA polymerase sigma-70 factor (ECF subfamily)